MASSNPVPRACVEAVRDLYPFSDAEKVASRVLAAFVEGEPDGTWTVDWDGNDGEVGWWIVSRMDADSLYCLTLRTKREADAVANALNYLEAHHA